MCRILHCSYKYKHKFWFRDVESILRCCCCHHWSVDHVLILCLWDERWYCGFFHLLSDLIKDLIKIYNVLWETPGLGLHTWEYLSFQLVLLPSFYSPLCLQTTEITEQDPKTSVCFPSKRHIYIKDHNYTKTSINSQKKHLFHRSKAVKLNVLGTVSQTSVIGPPESQTTLVSWCHFRLFRATDSLSQCQASTVASNESSSPSSPPLEAHALGKMSQIK